MDAVLISIICTMIVFILSVSITDKNKRFSDTRFKDTVLEFRAGKLTEVCK